MDIFTKSKRSEIMSRVGRVNTTPEKAVRSILHKLGYRFSLQKRSLPGSPDICLPRYRAVVFVHGCFWHRHRGCKYASTPKTRRAFWIKKFEANIARDKRVMREIKYMGWKSITVWQCELKDPERLRKYLTKKLPKSKRGKSSLA